MGLGLPGARARSLRVPALCGCLRLCRCQLPRFQRCMSRLCCRCGAGRTTACTDAPEGLDSISGYAIKANNNFKIMQVGLPFVSFKSPLP